MTAYEIGFRGQVVCGDCLRKVPVRKAAVVDIHTEFFLCPTCRTRDHGGQKARKEKEFARQVE